MNNPLNPDTRSEPGAETRKDTTRKHTTKYVLGLFAASVVGFLVFRLFISDDKSPSPLTTPYSSEIAAAFAGTLLTVIVTALLLEQTHRGQADLVEKQAELQNKLQSQTDESERKSQQALADQQHTFQKELLELTNRGQEDLEARQVTLQADLLTEQIKREAEKEKGVKIYETKLALYGGLMEAIEAGLCQIGETGATNSDEADDTGGDEGLSHQIIRMNFQGYRTAFISDSKVQEAVHNFAAEYSNVIAEKKMTLATWDELKEPLQTLINAVKADLAHHIRSDAPTASSSVQSSPNDAENVLIADFAPRRMNRERFLSQCEEGERDYFVQLLDYCQANPAKIVVGWNPKGFSVKDERGKHFLWVFPKEGANSKGNINARTNDFQTKREQIGDILRKHNVSKLSWRPGDGPEQLSFVETKEIIDLVCEI